MTNEVQPLKLPSETREVNLCQDDTCYILQCLYVEIKY